MSTAPPTRAALEEVLRDPPASLGSIALAALFVPPVLLAQRWLYDMLGLPRISNRAFFSLLLVTFAISCAALFPSPVWIRADRSGITVRNWLRLEHHPWRKIASIEVGNPDHARDCYLFLASTSSAERRAVPLPRLRSVSAPELAETLCARQRLHGHADPLHGRKDLG